MKITTPAIVLFFIFNTLLCQAQNEIITVKLTRNDDKTVDLSYYKHKFGTYNLSLLFSNLTNASHPKTNHNIKSQKGNLVKIRPLDKNKNINCTFRYWYIRGELNPKFNPDFVYLLPVSTTKQSEVQTLTNLETKYFGAEQPENWISYLFYTNVGDTAYAARKGTVVQIKKGEDYNNELSISYQSKVNSILIEHKDGTLAMYKGFDKNSIFVEEGDKVNPHSPLGIMAQYDKKKLGQLRFSVYYLSKIDRKPPEQKSIKNEMQHYSYITPLFLTEDGLRQLKTQQTYKGIIDQNIITKEFSRRELKKRAKAE